MPLVAPETEYTPRINQVDFSFSKTLHVRRASACCRSSTSSTRFNSDDYSAVATAQYGAATYLQPSVVLQGRIIRVGVDVTW